MPRKNSEDGSPGEESTLAALKVAGRVDGSAGIVVSFEAVCVEGRGRLFLHQAVVLLGAEYIIVLHSGAL